MANPIAGFSRVATVRIPVSPTSASTQFAFPDALKGVSNLYFEVENATPYDIRLEGTTQTNMDSGGFKTVTASSGWLVRARSSREPRVSKMPVFLSAAVFGTSGNPLETGVDYSDAFLDLIYLQRV